MSHLLVIAEKPSVGIAIGKALGVTTRKDGYLEGNGYIISWCIGHLVELADASAYSEQYKKWRQDDLPILPDRWQYAARGDKKKQLSVIKKLMGDKRVDAIVKACDAGREGKLNF